MRGRINILLACLLLGFTLAITAQNKTGSLKAVFNNQSSDTSQVTTYLQLYESLKYETPDEAIGYLETSIRLATKLNYKKGHLDGLLAKGSLLEITDQLDSALSIYSQAETLARSMENRKGQEHAILGKGKVYLSTQTLPKADSLSKLGLEMAKRAPVDSLHIALAYDILGGIAFSNGNYAKALDYDQKSLDYNKTYLERRVLSFINLSTTNNTLKDYDQAKKYAITALELAKKAKNRRTIAKSYQQLGIICVEQNNLAEAQDNFNKAIPNFRKIKDKSGLANVYYFQAKIYLERNEQDKAIAQYKLVLAALRDINEKVGTAYTLYDLGKLYLSAKNYAEAEAYLLKAKADFEKIKIPLMRMYTHLKLSELYAETGDYKKAYEYHLEQARINDSLFNVERVQKIDELEEKFQAEQQQQQIELLGAENEIATLKIQKQTNLRNYLILAAFLLLVLIGVVYNRYQLKNRANSKLKELDTLKTNFFTNISHEFRTPLTLILSPLQELRGQKNDTKTANALSVIHRNAKVLTNLTNQLLDLSKLEAGELALQIKEGDLKQFLKVVCASFESLAVAQNVHFVTQFEEAPETAFFDEDKVQKILNNLLSNAFKFTADEGKVQITALTENGHVLVSVEDNGSGIAEEDLRLIFKRFHQSAKNAPNTAGTGVGLTLSKELALLHHGDISVDSALGRGTTFTLKFPIQKSAYRPHQIGDETDKSVQPSQIPKPGTLAKANNEVHTAEKVVLLVEDNPDLSNHMRSLLEHTFQVKQSINGKVGITDALNFIPDIIITDLMMPEADGVEVCQTLKADEKTSHIPIIMLTAKADRDTKLDGLKTGADDFLTKPFDNAELMVRVQNLIDQRDKLREKFEQTLRLAPSKIKVKSPEEAFIKKALEVVDNNLSNSAFTVEAFQQEMGMSRMQLHRKLKVLTHFSASEFIRDIRLQRAADLLADKSLTVSEVAYSCGFNSVSYFTQCFTQKFGANPSKHLAKT